MAGVRLCLGRERLKPQGFCGSRRRAGASVVLALQPARYGHRGVSSVSEMCEITRSGRWGGQPFPRRLRGSSGAALWRPRGPTGGGRATRRCCRNALPPLPGASRFHLNNSGHLDPLLFITRHLPPSCLKDVKPGPWLVCGQHGGGESRAGPVGEQAGLGTLWRERACRWPVPAGSCCRLPVAILLVLRSLSTCSQRGLGPARGRAVRSACFPAPCGGSAAPGFPFPAPRPPPVPLEPAELALGACGRERL